MVKTIFSSFILLVSVCRQAARSHRGSFFTLLCFLWVQGHHYKLGLRVRGSSHHQQGTGSRKAWHSLAPCGCCRGPWGSLRIVARGGMCVLGCWAGIPSLLLNLVTPQQNRVQSCSLPRVLCLGPRS